LPHELVEPAVPHGAPQDEHVSTNDPHAGEACEFAAQPLCVPGIASKADLAWAEPERRQLLQLPAQAALTAVVVVGEVERVGDHRNGRRCPEQPAQAIRLITEAV